MNCTTWKYWARAFKRTKSEVFWINICWERILKSYDFCIFQPKRFFCWWILQFPKKLLNFLADTHNARQKRRRQGLAGNTNPTYLELLLLKALSHSLHVWNMFATTITFGASTSIYSCSCLGFDDFHCLWKSERDMLISGIRLNFPPL